MNGTIGFPIFYFYGKEGDYMVLVMEILGPSLEELLNYCNRLDIIFADVNYHSNITKDVDGNIDIASLNK